MLLSDVAQSVAKGALAELVPEAVSVFLALLKGRMCGALSKQTRRNFILAPLRGAPLACQLLLASIFVFLIVSSLLLYKVQYQTGIEILPFVPIDDSGFEYYNEQLLEAVEVSETALQQPNRGFLFCWVMTASLYHKNRVTAVNETWLPRCDASHVFTNSAKGLDDSIPFHTVFKYLPDSYFKLFWKTRLALFYIYSRVSSRFDWYFKADDDTYVIVETLRKYLAQFDPEKPYYIGYRLKRRMPEHGYNSGGSGYVLSRAAMAEFAEKLFYDRQACPYHEWEDYGIARCLGARGIYPLDSRDSLGRQRFLPWRPEEHFRADLTHQFIYDPIEHKGFDIFHNNLISLHHLNPDEIRLIDGILYHVAPDSKKRRGTRRPRFFPTVGHDRRGLDDTALLSPPPMNRSTIEVGRRLVEITVGRGRFFDMHYCP